MMAHYELTQMVLEDDTFFDSFCFGCRAGVAYGDDCPAEGDPRDHRCVRGDCWRRIEAELEDAEYTINDVFRALANEAA